MTRSRVQLLLTTFAAGLAVGFTIPALSGSVGSKVTNLLTAALSTEFTPGREVLIDLVEIPPNQKLDWHWHPGEEFHYYLEGNPVIERVDAPPIIGKPGTVGHVAFKQRHQAAAGDNGARILVFRVHTKGEPWRYQDEKRGDQGKSE
jgi:quercetin dioxygenase-like cupin family protein